MTDENSLASKITLTGNLDKPYIDMIVRMPDPKTSTGLMPDNQITYFAEKEDMIVPFSSELIRVDEDGGNVISYGLSSYGYDVRLGNKFKIFTNVNNSLIDPKNIDVNAFINVEGDYIIIPPNSFILAYSLEKIKMPDHVTGLVLSKSTYARAGINCLATPLEPGWEGHITLEYSNNTNLPVKMYAGEGCCQVLFFAANPCDVTYEDRSGKYMNQPAEPVIGKV